MVIVDKLPVSELVHSDRVVCWVLRVAGVRIVVIFRQQIHIMQENTAPVFIFQCLVHPDVQQLCSVKCGVTRLIIQTMS